MSKQKEKDKAQGNITETAKKKGALRENAEALVIALILALLIRTFIIQAFKIPTGSMLDTLQIGDHILVNKFIYGVKLPFVQKTVIPVSQPKRGDIVVFIYPIDKRDFIKRVVGVAGDTVEVRDTKVYINGVWEGEKSYERFTDYHHYSRTIPADKFEKTWLDTLAKYQEIMAKPGIFSDTEFYPFTQDLRRFILGNFRDNFGPVTVPEGHILVMGDNRDNSHDSRFWGFVPLDSVKGKAFIIYWSWNSEDVSVRWDRLGDILK